MNAGSRLSAGSCAAAFVALAMGAPACAGPAKLSVDTTVRLGYDINPFLSPGSDLASGYVEATVAPKLTKRTEKGVVKLSGHYERTEYLRRYGNSNQYGGELAVQQRVTPKLSIYGALRYDSEVIGQSDDVVTGAPIDDTDVNLIGLRRRADTYSVSGGWEYQVGPKDTLSANGGATATRYGSGPAGGDSDNIGGSVAWQHAISSRSKIGLSGSVYRIDYDTPGLSTMVMQPSVTFSTELSPTWHFDASLGMSFSDLTLPKARDESSKGLSGTVNLCHKGVKDNFCLYADRSVSGSGAGSTVERTQLGISYNRRLTEKLGFSANGSYARSKSQAGTIPTREYVSIRSGFDWQMTPRLKLGSEGRYRDVFGGRQIRADYGGDLYAILTLPRSQ